MEEIPTKASLGKRALGGQDGAAGRRLVGEHFRPAASTSILRGLIPALRRLLPDLPHGCESQRRLWGVLASRESLMKQGKYSQ